MAGLAIIAGIAWLIIRRGRKADPASSNDSDAGLGQGPGPGGEGAYYDDAQYAPEAVKYGSPTEATQPVQYKAEPQELNAHRPYAELPVQHGHTDAGPDSATYSTPSPNYYPPAYEMDATPR